MVSFGAPGERTEGQIYAAFGRWLDLFVKHPHKVLSFKSPYEAIDGMINPNGVLTVGELLDKHRAWAEKRVRPVRRGGEYPDLGFIDRAHQFLNRYRNWPLTSFGPDELENVQQALCSYEYLAGKKNKVKKRHTRHGINDIVAWIHRIWEFYLRPKASGSVCLMPVCLMPLFQQIQTPTGPHVLDGDPAGASWLVLKRPQPSVLVAGPFLPLTNTG